MVLKFPISNPFRRVLHEINAKISEITYLSNDGGQKQRTEN